MKKYLFGLIAIVLAVGFTAFTSVKSSKSKPLTTTTLYFDLNNYDEFTQADVETETAWMENVSLPPLCNGSNAACSIDVDISNTTGSAGSRVLDPSKVTITASGNIFTGFKPNAQAALVAIANKP